MGCFALYDRRSRSRSGRSTHLCRTRGAPHAGDPTRRPRRAALAVALVLVLVHAPSASAQVLPVGDSREEYLRALQLIGRADVGSFTVRPLGLDSARAALARAGHPWAPRFAPPLDQDDALPRIEATGAGQRTFLNTSLPVGQNDGAVWQGKGLTTALDMGAMASWRALSVTLQPTLIYTQNAAFELAPVTLAGMPEYAYPWRRIDMPQRFGPDAYWTLDPGASEIRVRAYGATVAFGTGNLWWGPGRRNALLMSNHAAGFPHLAIGTDGPAAIGIGDVEVQWIWGDLAQTEWFDPAFGDNDRFVTGIVGAYSPSFLDGLSVGLARVFYAWKPEGGLPLSDYFLVLQGVRKERIATPENPTGDDEHDQLLSFFARWVLAESGFEVYAEWARNDHSWNFRDFILEPEHSQAYLLGLQKVVELSGNRLLSLTGEITHLERSTTRELRATPTYYAHHIVRQGYTQRGQVIGAGVGPGGNAQHVGADLYAPWGRAGVWVQRDVRDNDAFYTWAASTGGSRWEHDVMLHLGGHGMVFVADVEVGGGLVLTREFNRHFVGRDLWNLNVSLSARWRPR